MNAFNSVAPRLKPEMASSRLLVLDFVRSYILRWHASPSINEIAAGTNLPRTSVRRALRRLVAAGDLTRRPGPRGLALPEAAREALRQLEAAGWRIDPTGGIAVAPSGPKATLLTLPALDYTPERGTQTGQPDREGARRKA